MRDFKRGGADADTSTGLSFEQLACTRCSPPPTVPTSVDARRELLGDRPAESAGSFEENGFRRGTYRLVKVYNHLTTGPLTFRMRLIHSTSP